MTRELKLALIVGFGLVLVVTVLISDHLSRARRLPLAPAREDPVLALGPGVEPARLPTPAQPPAARYDEPSPERSAEASPDGMGFSRFQEAEPFSDLIREAQRMGMNVLRGPDGQWHITPVAQHETVRTQPTPETRPNPMVPEERVRPLVPEARPASEADRMYAIAAGDSLYGLSQRFYGDAKYWRQLAAYNKDRVGDGSVLRVGVTIAVPTLEKLTGKPSPGPRDEPRSAASGRPTTAPAVPPSPAEKARTYTVRKGDTLGQISQRMLGSARRAGEITRLNGLEDEDTVRIGMVLKLPAR